MVHAVSFVACADTKTLRRRETPQERSATTSWRIALSGEMRIRREIFFLSLSLFSLSMNRPDTWQRASWIRTHTHTNICTHTHAYLSIRFTYLRARDYVPRTHTRTSGERYVCTYTYDMRSLSRSLSVSPPPSASLGVARSCQRCQLVADRPFIGRRVLRVAGKKIIDHRLDVRHPPGYPFEYGS